MEGTVTVKVKVLASAEGTELNNQARVGMDEANITTITDNGGDEDETTTNFVAVKSVVNADGTDIDKQVVAVDDLVTYHIPYQNHSKNTRTIMITDVLPQDVTYVEASEGGNVQSIVHGQTVIWVLEAAPKTDGEVWVTVKVTKALKGQAFANSAMLEVKNQEIGQTKKAVTNQVINYVLDDVVKEVLSENGRKNLEGEKVGGGRTLLYRVTFKNPATTERTFTVTDELPEGVTFVSAENDGSYDESTNTITWTVALGSGSMKTKDPENDIDLPEINFKALQQVNPDVIGWIYSPETTINYPVVQGDDNAFYLKHLADGTENRNGCPFLDLQNRSDFSDDNSIIYGHHMQNGTMFAGISW